MQANNGDINSLLNFQILGVIEDFSLSQYRQIEAGLSSGSISLIFNAKPYPDQTNMST